MNFEDNNGNSSHWVCIYNNQGKYYFELWSSTTCSNNEILTEWCLSTISSPIIKFQVLWINYVFMCYFNSTTIKKIYDVIFNLT